MDRGIGVVADVRGDERDRVVALAQSQRCGLQTSLPAVSGVASRESGVLAKACVDPLA